MNNRITSLLGLSFFVSTVFAMEEGNSRSNDNNNNNSEYQRKLTEDRRQIIEEQNREYAQLVAKDQEKEREVKRKREEEKRLSKEEVEDDDNLSNNNNNSNNNNDLSAERKKGRVAKDAQGETRKNLPSLLALALVASLKCSDEQAQQRLPKELLEKRALLMSAGSHLWEGVYKSKIFEAQKKYIECAQKKKRSQLASRKRNGVVYDGSLLEHKLHYLRMRYLSVNSPEHLLNGKHEAYMNKVDNLLIYHTKQELNCFEKSLDEHQSLVSNLSSKTDFVLLEALLKLLGDYDKGMKLLGKEQNKRAWAEKTLLWYAIQIENLPLIKFLWDHKVDNAGDGNVAEMVRRLYYKTIKQIKTIKDIPAKLGFLGKLIDTYHLDLSERLFISDYVQPHCVCPIYHVTWLIGVSENVKTELIKWHIAHKTKINHDVYCIPGRYIRVIPFGGPLRMAILNCYPEIVEMLVNNGAHIDPSDLQYAQEWFTKFPGSKYKRIVESIQKRIEQTN